MSEAEGGTSLGQFPKAVLMKIISLIPRQDDGNVRLICKTFKELFDETIGVSWGKFCYADEQDTRIEDFEELPRCRSFDLSVLNHNDFHQYSIPIFKSKRLLKDIKLDGEVTDSSLNRLLTDLNSLENLEISRWAITNLTSSLFTKDLINLKTIKFRIPFTSDRLYIKLIGFLKIAQFQNLQNFRIEVNEPICENMFCDAFLTFLIQHKQTLSVLWICFLYMNQNGRDHQDWPNLPDFAHRLNQLEILQIEEVTFLNTYRFKSTKLAEIFDKIIQSGKMIKKADECSIICVDSASGPKKSFKVLDNYDEQTLFTMLKPIPTTMIQNNCSTLAQIGMNIIPENCHPLDCSIFIPCKSLNKLRLLTRQNSGSELVNVTALPQTLETFHVSNFQLKSEDIHSIVTSYLGLKCIFLARTGTTNGYGVTSQSFASLIARRTKGIYINDSWNLDDFMESLNHRGPFQRLQALSLVQTKKVKDGNGRRANVFMQPMKPKQIFMTIPNGSKTYVEVEIDSAK